MQEPIEVKMPPGKVIGKDRFAGKRCDCGHLVGHHNEYRHNIYYRAHTRCMFGGCGCPKFIAVGPDDNSS